MTAAATPRRNDVWGTAGMTRGQALAAALKRAFGMSPEDAESTARVVEAHYRGGDEVDDNDLTPDARMIFYTLENMRVVVTRRDEFNLANGEHRRAFFWRFKDEELYRQAVAGDDAPMPEAGVYEQLPPKAWSRPATAS